MSIIDENQRHSSEAQVRERYSAAANALEPSLCCPVSYNSDHLQIIPQEIIDRDYGCGDPTQYVRGGETVLDLGSGGGKICYILSQVVGAAGKVVGVDCNREMLALARSHQETVAKSLGYANVSFRCGLIQDLALDLDLLAEELRQRPVADQFDWLEMRAGEERLRREQTMIADGSIDCIVSNCVLNLVRRQDRAQLLGEMHRVLKRGGRVAISDIVSDQDVPQQLQQDPELWSGCISGAYREDAFLKAFEEAGFHGVAIAAREEEPWRTVQGIEFRSLTVTAYKGKAGPCLERNQALVYRGPFRKVEDDDGHLFRRGERTAVCDKTFHLLQNAPYDEAFIPIEPREEIPLDAAQDFDCRRHAVRSPQDTKGAAYDLTVLADDCCGDGGCC